MSDGFHSDGILDRSGDHQICDAYLRSDFIVTSGLNLGDNLGDAGQSSVGDSYLFSPDAASHDLAVGPSNDPSEAELGTLGDGFQLESRLTFFGSDGSKVDVLTLSGPDADESDDDIDHATPGYFLPVSPLKPGVEYTLIKADDDPGDFSFSDYTCVCFTRGTMIRMSDGTERAIELIGEGDSILTRDNGAQAVRWIGSRTTPAYGHLAPIVITKDALGNHADLIVSQQHRILLADWRAEVMMGSHEVLVKARDLTNGDTIYRREGGVVEYFHILFDTHEIIYAEGIPSESLHINATTLDSMAEESRAEIIELFPNIQSQPQVSAVASRMSLRSYEASALLKQVGFR
ncbi:MAG: Hint domain-containing protein [Alphaproteobacteria bacterium]|nr:Hint domain-containing protein [Alphaproteobacteria bacterium]